MVFRHQIRGGEILIRSDGKTQSAEVFKKLTISHKHLGD